MHPDHLDRHRERIAYLSSGPGATAFEERRIRCMDGEEIVIETAGVLGKGDAPYVVDTLTLPDGPANPWHSWIRTSGVGHPAGTTVTFPAGAWSNGTKQQAGGNFAGVNTKRDIPMFVRLIEAGQFDAKSLVGGTAGSKGAYGVLADGSVATGDLTNLFGWRFLPAGTVGKPVLPDLRNLAPQGFGWYICTGPNSFLA